MNQNETNILAIARHLAGQLSEDVLAKKLGHDLPETRQAVADFLNQAIANAGVPIERISLLEQCCATANAHVGRLNLDLVNATERIADIENDNHALRDRVQTLLVQNSEITSDLEAERHRLAELARQTGQAETHLVERAKRLRATLAAVQDYLLALPAADPDILTGIAGALEVESLFNKEEEGVNQ